PRHAFLGSYLLEEHDAVHHRPLHMRTVIALDFERLDIQSPSLPQRGETLAHHSEKRSLLRSIVQTQRAFDTARIRDWRSELNLPQVAPVEGQIPLLRKRRPVGCAREGGGGTESIGGNGCQQRHRSPHAVPSNEQAFRVYVRLLAEIVRGGQHIT